MSEVAQLKSQINTAAMNLEALTRVVATQKNFVQSLAQNVESQLGSTATRKDKEMQEFLRVVVMMLDASGGRISKAASQAKDIASKI